MFVVKQHYPGEGFCKDSRGGGDDPDSRMDSERADRRDKKGGKGKVHQYFHTSHFCMQVMIQADPLCLL